jgi:hypothetical protein
MNNGAVIGFIYFTVEIVCPADIKLTLKKCLFPFLKKLQKPTHFC